MRIIALLSLVLFVARADDAQAIDHMMVIAGDTPVGSVDVNRSPQSTVPSQPVVCTGVVRETSGYLWKYSNGATKRETFVAYSKRTGKSSPATAPCCTSGYCGTFAKSPTLPSAGCTCGCHAASCNCHHSKNAGKPLKAQSVATEKSVLKQDSPLALVPVGGSLPAGTYCVDGQCYSQSVGPLRRLFGR